MDAALLGDKLPEVTRNLVTTYQAASLFAVAGIERARKCLQGEHSVTCCHSTCFSAFQGFSGVATRGSAAVCDPNPPRPFARSRDDCVDISISPKMLFQRGQLRTANSASFWASPSTGERDE